VKPAGVLRHVLEHVDQGVADLARGGQRPGVITIAPHSASASEGAIDGARHADGEAAEPIGQARPVVGLDDQVEMIRLGRTGGATTTGR